MFVIYDVAKFQMTENGLLKSTIHCLHELGSQKSQNGHQEYSFLGTKWYIGLYMEACEA